VAIQGSERVEVRDAFSFDVAGSIHDVGSAPQGIALSPDGKRLWLQVFLSRSVRVYDVSDLSIAPLPLAEVATVGEEPLAPEVLLGKQIFYRSRDPRMSKSSYLSCASCHLDGEGDNLVWDFTQRGEGLRDTIPLAGRAGTAHGPLHWSANFDEVQDFEHDIRGPMSGLGFLPDDVFHSGTVDTTLGDPKAGLSPELDALAAYVSSLASFGKSPYRSEDPAFLASRENGRQIFLSGQTGCATCHAPPRFTDSALPAGGDPLLHDVGTLGPGSGSRLGGPLLGIDTPTLRGLWKSAPYLHDGSAPTLRAVLRDRNPADQHGATSQLSDAELTDLENYLLTIDDDEP
jgi:cytochrome c peroxidase